MVISFVDILTNLPGRLVNKLLLLSSLNTDIQTYEKQCEESEASYRYNERNIQFFS